ncbi:putative glycosyltransferase [Acorus gramineus]|uniref:Glycosyltransferase n=1 Tax=Acorus gramineus TaxID=55184 RepID=A0AAV9AB41_ACOGR|nr:putative glycosyltransferase [Acorus gramineus]
MEHQKVFSDVGRWWFAWRLCSRVDWRVVIVAVALVTTTAAVLRTSTIFPSVSPSSFSTSSDYSDWSPTLSLPPQAEPERVLPSVSVDLVQSSPPEVPLIGSGSLQVESKPIVSDDLWNVISLRSSRASVSRETARVFPPIENAVELRPPERELVYAKREIERAPIVIDDPDLYSPLFRNVSVFKRSYEMMEKLLKVYIYRDGSRPIFHQPFLKGIYASEGWFLKLLVENKQFVTKDESKAHLFYLPYSARQLELALYVPDSHNLRPLSIFLRDYINLIASKYPFWNRTHGSDHFLVACHDWGSYTTTEHEELCKNTIKALCNADASEGIFIRGKDVSLPETIIRNPRRPLREVGGKPVSQRSILAFFAGNMHGRVRPMLLQYWGSGKDEDMKIYGPLPNRVSRKMSYTQHMKSSKFCICPMGYEVNSPRIVEAIYYECVPVIIADNFVLPFDEVLDWSAFSVVVAEKDIPQLKDILSAISLKQYISMQTNIKRLQKHFLWHAKPIKYDIFHMILHSIWFNKLNRIHIF